LIDPATRERAVLALLEEWPWHLGGVLIGGNAMSAYGPPRYSIDVDIVVSTSSMGWIRTWLTRTGFRLVPASTPDPPIEDRQVEQYRSDGVTLDLIAGAVRDRESHVEIPEAWIAKHHRRMRLETLSGRSASPIPVARPEAIWALKLLAGQDQDLADLFAISEEPVQLSEVRSLFVGMRTNSLSGKFQNVLAKLRTPRLYEDSLSRRAMGRPPDPHYIRNWDRFVLQVESVLVAVATPTGDRSPAPGSRAVVPGPEPPASTLTPPLGATP
jgi:hypothetical protein